jgi:hypothetical protein
MASKDDEGFVEATKAWLQSKGFPLEMEVASAFHESGFGVRQGWYFQDPEENKPREIDVLAHLNSDAGHPAMLQVIVECKRVEFPFLVFSYSDRNPSKPNPELLQCTSAGKAFIASLVGSGAIDTLPLFSRSRPISYDMKQVPVRVKEKEKGEGTKGFKDEAFDALNKVSKATWSNIAYFEDRHPSVKKQAGDIASFRLAYIAVPLVVVDGPLLECFLDSSGHLQVVPIESALVNWSNPFVGNIPILVYVKDELSSLIGDLVGTRDEMERLKVELH